MRKLLTDRRSGEALIWLDSQTDDDGGTVCMLHSVDAVLAEVQATKATQAVERFLAAVPYLVAAWVRHNRQWWQVRPHIPVPGVAWCPYGDTVALVWRGVGAGEWHGRGERTFTDWADALTSEVQALAKLDGLPPGAILAGRRVQVWP